MFYEANRNLCFFYSSSRVAMRKPDEQWVSDRSLCEVNSDDEEAEGQNQCWLLLCSKLGEALDERDR